MATTSSLYYDPARSSRFSTLPKLRAAAEERKCTPQTVGTIKVWLEEQDAYTPHRLVRKRFTRNPYNMSNVMEVSECELLDIQAYAKYNNNYRSRLSHTCNIEYSVSDLCENKERTCSRSGVKVYI